MVAVAAEGSAIAPVLGRPGRKLPLVFHTARTTRSAWPFSSGMRPSRPLALILTDRSERVSKLMLPIHQAKHSGTQLYLRHIA